MTSNILHTSGESNSLVAALSILIGILVVGYGLLVTSASPLGGAWIVAIGIALLLSGLFATDAVGDRLGLAPNRRRQLSLGCSGLAALLAVAFVVINGATFETEELEGAASALRR
ncbi:hypothetical protein JMJ58_17100 [Haloterrigena salifodinae]|uniref:Uncharacterized protein n=1 Tax=Haloterrigena salifodinae TaxID=2675099 RepID=A0A8T8DZM4_9EURY|nr:hypothetical protein [Haloterrigena salifodinae]QRV14631.1 hypothetical protein JMJ58_17100 [Haloterrigena salifodinae]